MCACACVFSDDYWGKAKEHGRGVWVDDDCQRQRRLRECKFMYLCVECVECVCGVGVCMEWVCVCVCVWVGG